MGAPDDQRVVAVCRGTSCARKRAEEHGALLDALRGVAAVEEVRCLGVCRGPVAAVVGEEGVVVVERIRSKKARRSLVGLATGGRLDARLEKRVVAGGRGKKAAGKVRKRLAR